MTLEQLEKKLYRPGGGEELEHERKENTEYDPFLSASLEGGDPQKPEWKEIPPGFFARNKKLIIIGSAVFILALGGIVGLVSYQRSKGIFDREKVAVIIDGPKTVTSGEILRFSIIYQNKSNVALGEVELSIVPPKDLDGLKITMDGKESDFSKNIKIGTVEKQSEGKIELSGRIIGPEKNIYYTEAILSFKPVNISSKFETTAKFSTTIKDTPLQFSLNAPKQVFSGEEVHYTFDVVNNTENNLDSVEVKWEFPDGFRVKQSDPELSKDNAMKIAHMDAKDSLQLKVIGNLSGNIDDNKIVKVVLGQNQNNNFVKYGEEQSPTKIADAYLTISQLVNGSTDYKASPGEKLNYRLSYKNNTTVGIGEVIVQAKLESTLLNFQSLETNGGSFDDGTKTITWKGASAPGLLVLSPQEEGELQFSIAIKDRLPIAAYDDKNFTIVGVAEISSSEIPASLNANKIIQSNESTVKINSKLVLQAKGYYKEPTASISNSGPIPPKVNQETTYTIHWQVLNLTNDVENVKLMSSLPPNTRWTNQTTTNNGTNLKYNEKTNEIIWEIGKIKANTGIIYPTIEAVFQVALTPSSNLIGIAPDLVEDAQISGKDNFTGIDLSAEAKKVTTKIPDDSQYGGKGEVVE